LNIKRASRVRRRRRGYFLHALGRIVVILKMQGAHDQAMHAPETNYHEELQNFCNGKVFLQRREGSVLDEIAGKNLIRRRHHRTFDWSEKIAGRPAFDSSKLLLSNPDHACNLEV